MIIHRTRTAVTFKCSPSRESVLTFIAVVLVPATSRHLTGVGSAVVAVAPAPLILAEVLLRLPIALSKLPVGARPRGRGRLVARSSNEGGFSP